MIQGLLLDLDDTLYEYSQLEPEARKAAEDYAEQTLQIERVLFQKAVQLGKEQVKRQLPFVAAGHSRVLYYQRALEVLGYPFLSAALELEQIYWKTCLERMKVREGVEELLTLVKEKGWKVGICTDLTAQIQLQKIRVLGIERWIDCIGTSEEAGIEKPDPRFFRFCLEKMKLKADEVLMVGDSLYRDIEGAENAGIRAIWYVNHRGEEKERKGAWVRSFAELIEEVTYEYLER